MAHDDKHNDPDPNGSGKTVSPGGPVATPETKEGQQAANEEGEEA